MPPPPEGGFVLPAREPYEPYEPYPPSEPYQPRDIDDPERGRGLVIGGSAVMAAGGALLTVGLALYSRNPARAANFEDFQRRQEHRRLGLPIALGGTIALVGVGTPLLVAGLVLRQRSQKSSLGDHRVRPRLTMGRDGMTFGVHARF